MREMKDSGIEWIGKIPKNKKIIRNKYMFKYEKGKLPSNTNTEKIGVPYIGASDLDSNTDEYVIYTEDETLPDAKIDDLLVLWDGARAGLAGTKKCGKISSTIVKISADDTVYTSFLYWYYKGFEKYMSDSVTGTTIPHMNRKYIEDIQFIDWGIDEQKKMTEYLDEKCAKIDAIIEKQQEIIEKLKEYKLSVITEAVTKGLNPDIEMKESGIEWVDSIPIHWNKVKLKYVAYVRARLGWKGLKAEEYVAEGYPLLSAFNIVNSKIDFKNNINFINRERYEESPEIMLSIGDILLVKDGAGIGKCGIIEQLPLEATTNGSIAVITTNERLCPKYLYYFFVSSIFQQYVDRIKDGMGVPHLFQSDLKEIEIVWPDREEQALIIDFLNEKVSRLDEKIEIIEKIIEKSLSYKKSLIYEVVTGKREV